MTQVDPPSSVLVFKVSGTDPDVPDLSEESDDYLLARERDERAAAKNAKNGVARSIHQQLAQTYADLRHRTAR